MYPKAATIWPGVSSPAATWRPAIQMTTPSRIAGVPSPSEFEPGGGSGDLVSGLPQGVGVAPVGAVEPGLAADAAQHAQARDDVGGALGDVADALAVGLLAVLEPGEQRAGDEADDEDADEDGEAQGDRGVEQEHADRDEPEDAARGGREGVDGPGDAVDVGGPDAHDLAGGELAAEVVAEPVDLPGCELECAVRRVHSPEHGEPVRPDDHRGGDEPGEDHRDRPEGERAPVSFAQAVVDRAGEEEREHGQGPERDARR